MLNFDQNPNRLMFIAVGMLLFGCIVPFLMVLDVVKSTLFINFLSFTLSTLGLFLGIISIAMIRRKSARKKDEDDWRE